jgi:protein-S-isoprenylcysteine O-methyltransferase Ste14
MERKKAELSAYCMLMLSIVAGGGGLLAVGLMILFGAPGWLDLGWPLPGDMVWNTVLSLAFFVQHSAMIRQGVRHRILKRIPEGYAGAVFSIVSGLTLFAVVLLWQPSASMLVELTGMGFWIARLFACAALAGFFWTAKSLRTLDALGTRALLARMAKARRDRSAPITVRGPYRWVRHPFYFFTIVMIWSFPALGADRLLFNVIWTVWIWIGTVFEERDLLDQFGSDYETYRRNVPRILPFKWR